MENSDFEFLKKELKSDTLSYEQKGVMAVAVICCDGELDAEKVFNVSGGKLSRVEQLIREIKYFGQYE